MGQLAEQFSQNQAIEGMAIATDGFNIDSLNAWRTSILDQAAMVLTDPAQNLQQKQAGVWERSGSLPIPARSSMTITNSGFMVFDVRIGNYNVHYCVWITFGEIRIGVKVATPLIQSEATRKKLSESYDGSTCSRQVAVGQATFFDWIFRDGFASFGCMTTAIRDQLLGAVVAKRTGEILTHIYVTTLGLLAESHANLTVGVEPHVPAEQRTMKVVTFTGDVAYFEEFVIARGARFVTPPQQNANDDLFFAKIETDESGCGITRGSHGERSRMIRIRDIETAR